MEIRDDKPVTKAEKDAIDLHDLALEKAGLDVGRQPRMLGSAIYESISQRKAKDDRRKAYRSLLEQLLRQDAIYRKTYFRAYEALIDAEVAVLTALGNIDQAIRNAEMNLDDFIADASRLPTGEAVFCSSETGEIVTAEGQVLSPDESESIVWRANAPTLEELQSAEQRLTNLKDDRGTIIQFQEQTIDPARQSLDNLDEPLSLDELEAYIQQLDERMPQAIKTWSLPLKRPEQGMELTETDIGELEIPKLVL